MSLVALQRLGAVGDDGGGLGQALGLGAQVAGQALGRGRCLGHRAAQHGRLHSNTALSGTGS